MKRTAAADSFVMERGTATYRDESMCCKCSSNYRGVSFCSTEGEVCSVICIGMTSPPSDYDYCPGTKIGKRKFNSLFPMSAPVRTTQKMTCMGRHVGHL